MGEKIDSTKALEFEKNSNPFSDDFEHSAGKNPPPPIPPFFGRKTQRPPGRNAEWGHERVGHPVRQQRQEPQPEGTVGVPRGHGPY